LQKEEASIIGMLNDLPDGAYHETLVGHDVIGSDLTEDSLPVENNTTLSTN
jgi:hypothetical protein